MKEITLREWIKNFNEGVYESMDVQTQTTTITGLLTTLL